MRPVEVVSSCESAGLRHATLGDAAARRCRATVRDAPLFLGLHRVRVLLQHLLGNHQTRESGSIHLPIGPKSAGKTTCFNLLTKLLEPATRLAAVAIDIAHHVRGGRLVPLLIDCSPPAADIYVVFQTTNQMPARARTFVDRWSRSSSQVGRAATSPSGRGERSVHAGHDEGSAAASKLPSCPRVRSPSSRRDHRLVSIDLRHELHASGTARGRAASTLRFVEKPHAYVTAQNLRASRPAGQTAIEFVATRGRGKL